MRNSSSRLPSPSVRELVNYFGGGGQRAEEDEVVDDLVDDDVFDQADMNRTCRDQISMAR